MTQARREKIKNHLHIIRQEGKTWATNAQQVLPINMAINHNYKVINIIIIVINNYEIKQSSCVTCITTSGGSEQAITHIRECHGDSNQYITL
jgi:hypothetical protein